MVLGLPAARRSFECWTCALLWCVMLLAAHSLFSGALAAPLPASQPHATTNRTTHAPCPPSHTRAHTPHTRAHTCRLLKPWVDAGSADQSGEEGEGAADTGAGPCASGRQLAEVTIDRQIFGMVIAGGEERGKWWKEGWERVPAGRPLLRSADRCRGWHRAASPPRSRASVHPCFTFHTVPPCPPATGAQGVSHSDLDSALRINLKKGGMRLKELEKRLGLRTAANNKVGGG